MSVQFISSGGLTTVDVFSRGLASATIISNGGLQQIFSGGTASGTVVDSGGREIVSSGGVESAAVTSGGVVELASGGSMSSVTFASSSGGTLQLDGTGFISGAVGSFGSGDIIDFRAVAFSGSTLSWNQLNFSPASGTLTVSGVQWRRQREPHTARPIRGR
jgi:autotransporter passenger strand-loop-strand repeat protein